MSRLKKPASLSVSGKGIAIKQKSDKKQELVTHRTLCPEIQAAMSLAFGYQGTVIIDPKIAAVKLRQQTAAIVSGDLSSLERMLVSQIAAMDMTFHEFLRKSLAMHDASLAKEYLFMAFRAQGNTRASIQVLSEMSEKKKPRYIRSMNSLEGKLVVSDFEQTEGRPKLLGRSNKLLNSRKVEDEKLDSGGAKKTGQGHQEMASVGKGSRPQNGTRKRDR